MPKIPDEAFLTLLEHIKNQVNEIIEIQNSIGHSDWVLMGTTSLLAITAFLGPYVIERWKSKFYSPILSFEFKHEPSYCHKTELKGNSNGTSICIPAYYFRFQAMNKGRHQAEQCKIVLEKVWKENNEGNYKQWENFSPVPLKWSGLEKNRYIPLQPGRKVFCDIGSILPQEKQKRSVYLNANEEDQSTNKFFFEMVEIYFSQWDCLLPGKYKIGLALYCANSNKVKNLLTLLGQESGKKVNQKCLVS